MQGPLNVKAVYLVVAIFLGATKQTVGVYFKSVYDHFLLNRFPFITPYHYIITNSLNVQYRALMSNKRQK
jgi:hypothetical protein